MIFDGKPDDRRDNSAMYHALDDLRDDVREDIGRLRDDMREDNERLEGRMMSVVNGFVAAHGQEHLAMRRENEDAHDRFDSFIRAAELAQARRDGALGVFRFVLEQVSRHWKPITAVLAALATVILAAAGNIRFEVIAG